MNSELFGTPKQRREEEALAEAYHEKVKRGNPLKDRLPKLAVGPNLNKVGYVPYEFQHIKEKLNKMKADQKTKCDKQAVSTDIAEDLEDCGSYLYDIVGRLDNKLKPISREDSLIMTTEENTVDTPLPPYFQRLRDITTQIEQSTKYLESILRKVELP